MSNRLYNVALTVAKVQSGPDGETRPIWPSEIHILKELANDARDEDGGWTDHKGTSWLRKRTQLSESAIRKAYAVLIFNGHITRGEAPVGTGAKTLVHPRGVAFGQPQTHVMSTGVGGETHVMSTRVDPETHVMSTWVGEPPGGSDPPTHVMSTWDPCNENTGNTYSTKPNKKEARADAGERARDPADLDEPKKTESESHTEIGGLQPAKDPEIGGLQILKTPDLGAKDPLNRGSDSLIESQERGAGAGARAIEPRPPGPTDQEMLGEGECGQTADPYFDAWDAMERSGGLPGPVVRTVPREQAINRKLGEVGPERLLTLIGDVGREWALAKAGRSRVIERQKTGQADWRLMFDQVWQADPQFRSSKLFDQLLNAPPPPPPTIAEYRDALAILLGGQGRNLLAGVEFEFDPASDRAELMIFAPTTQQSAQLEYVAASRALKLAGSLFGERTRVFYRDRETALAPAH